MRDFLAKFVMPLVLLAALSDPASAERPDAQDNSPVQIGRGLICDTPGQVERYATLFDGDAEKAIKTVNEEANKENACAVAAVAFVVASDESKIVRAEQGSFRVVQILVMGVVTPAGMQRVAPLPQYTLVKVDEIEV